MVLLMYVGEGAKIKLHNNSTGVIPINTHPNMSVVLVATSCPWHC